eukprot:TRINITY_DN43433_c0_g1_i1.p1 TRINITY_DN43433_c0_g1~~TRINITY_DN43433_c0_g1_i1.p1  ORF type:complete len:146 (+),score=19.54 TRINITY_DN43433_c0_g1_i1:82-519(+)
MVLHSVRITKDESLRHEHDMTHHPLPHVQAAAAFLNQACEALSSGRSTEAVRNFAEAKDLCPHAYKAWNPGELEQLDRFASELLRENASNGPAAFAKVYFQLLRAMPTQGDPRRTYGAGPAVETATHFETMFIGRWVCSVLRLRG